MQQAPAENGGEGGPRIPQHAFEVEPHALQKGNGLRRQHSGGYKGGSPHRRGGRFDPGDPEDVDVDDTEPLMAPGEPPDSAKRHLQRSISVSHPTLSFQNPDKFVADIFVIVLC